MFAVTGLAVDGTRAFLFRRTLQSVADSSALAAAGEVSRVRYYASAGRDLRLAPLRASEIARQWLTRRGIHMAVEIQSDQDHIRVVARAALRPTFLSLVGIKTIPVAVEASARPVPGALPR